jgi:hypothetical protein
LDFLVPHSLQTGVDWSLAFPVGQKAQPEAEDWDANSPRQKDRLIPDEKAEI